MVSDAGRASPGLRTPVRGACLPVIKAARVGEQLGATHAFSKTSPAFAIAVRFGVLGTSEESAYCGEESLP
jgi:hypothetical protein